MIRRFATSVAGVLVCSLAASCASSPATNRAGGSGTVVRPFGAGAAANSPEAAATSQDMPTPPRDAQYTIYCQSITGPNHIDEARAVRQSLLAGTDLRDWYLVHAADKSTLYYGFYASIDPRDPRFAKQGKKALADLDRIRTLTDEQGSRPFSSSLPVPLDTPDPTANPAWDLTRTDGYYSLAIAVYKDSPDRKQFTVDAVRGFRSEGVEAYYYHAENASFVCIGSWPKAAATENDGTDQNTNPDTPLVVTMVPLPEQMTQELNQKGFKTVTPTIQPVDPSLIEAMRKFKEFSTNGETMMHRVTDPATGQSMMVPSSSYLVKVPHDDSNASGNVPMAEGGAGEGTDSTPQPTTPPPATAAPGMGGLKSLGD